MIKLTNVSNDKPTIIVAEHIICIEPVDDVTKIDCNDRSLHFVKESPEDVARKVLEYRLAMERYKAALITDKKEYALSEYQNIKQLAGLAE